MKTKEELLNEYLEFRNNKLVSREEVIDIIKGEREQRKYFLKEKIMSIFLTVLFTLTIVLASWFIVEILFMLFGIVNER